MKVLVTGASGFTGGHLARSLASRGHAVRVLARRREAARVLAGAGYQVVEGDLRDRARVDEAVAGTDQVYHVAAAYRVAGKPDSYYREINVGGTRNILESATRHGVARVLHCSTVGVHGDVGAAMADESSPFNPGDIYQVTKLEGERLAAEAFAGGLGGVIFRPGAIYGPGDTRFLKLFRAIRNRRFAMIGSGRVRYHLVYVDDLVDGILRCGSEEKALGQTFILAGDRPVTLNEFVGMVGDAVGARPLPWRVPLMPVRLLAWLCEAVCTPIGIEPPLYPRRVDFFRKERAFRIDKAKRELGYMPVVDATEGIRRTAEWYFRQGLMAPREPRSAGTGTS